MRLEHVINIAASAGIGQRHGGPWLVLALTALACAEIPDVPANPTWADVAPILNRHCNHCHGATAAKHGSVGSVVYRFDFYDLADGSCGEAAAAIDLPAMALGSAARMKDSIATINGVRPRMPPAPGPLMPDWERDTLDRWSRQSPPPKGSPPWNNRPPRLRIFKFPAKADQTVTFTAILQDPDGDSVIGIIKAGQEVFKLDRAGSFVVSIDTSKWPSGKYEITAVLCDGWVSPTFGVGQVEVTHAR